MLSVKMLAHVLQSDYRLQDMSIAQAKADPALHCYVLTNVHAGG